MADSPAEHDTVDILGGNTIVIFRCKQCEDIHLEYTLGGATVCMALNNQEAIALADTLYRYARRVS